MTTRKGIKMGREQIMRALETEIAVQATGCRGAGGYRDYAESQGYDHCEVLDWTSSAGDWSFLVSEDGHAWRVMFQTNNWPRAGFTYDLGDEVFFGTFEEAAEQAWAWG